MAVETVYLDHARFPDIGDELTADASLYALLESRYGVVPAGADETIETVLAPPAAARLLGTDAATPMLLLTRSTRDASGRPVEYVRSLYRGDRFRFSTHLTRPLSARAGAIRQPTGGRSPDRIVTRARGRSSPTGSVAGVVVDDQQVGLVGGGGERRPGRRSPA